MVRIPMKESFGEGPGPQRAVAALMTRWDIKGTNVIFEARIRKEEATIFKVIRWVTYTHLITELKS